MPAGRAGAARRAPARRPAERQPVRPAADGSAHQRAAPGRAASGTLDPGGDREQPPGGHAGAHRRDLAPVSATGINFAVDDMGAGYSGLRQITTVRPSYLKLDRSLISGIDTDPDRGALVSAMLGYVRQTGGHLVAEGVETEAELDTLHRSRGQADPGLPARASEPRPGRRWPSRRRSQRPPPSRPATAPSSAVTLH